MQAMRAHARKMDDSRPVTYAQNSGLTDQGAIECCDIVGVNYQTEMYDTLHKKHPNKPMFAAETIGYIKGRLDEVKHYWRMVDTRAFVMGLFAWTGMDYRGEAFHWPDVFFRFGALDPCCAPKEGFHLYRAYWREEPIVHIVPHWNWQGKEGEDIEVWVYTNADNAELFLNGISKGKKPVDRYEQVKWKIPFEPGILAAVARRGTAVIAEDKVETTGPAAALSLKLENPGVKADGEDVAIINAYPVDAEGRWVPNADGILVEFQSNECGKLISIGEGDARGYQDWEKPERRTRRGYIQAIVRTTGKQGLLRVTARNEHLGETALSIDLIASSRRQFLGAEANPYVPTWKMSPLLKEAPEVSGKQWKSLSRDWPVVELADQTHPAWNEQRGYVVYYAESRIPESPNPEDRVFLRIVDAKDRTKIVIQGKDGAVKATRELRLEKGSNQVEFAEIEVPGCRPGDETHIWAVLDCTNSLGVLGNAVYWSWSKQI
jgi:Domain of unknown function (DUF4982)/Glycoside hydrolase family 2 C-terminal domain 5/Glycosyl hydrolases family 2, TIM barrel domain